MAPECRARTRRGLLQGGLALAGLGLLAGCGIRAPWTPRPTRLPRVGLLAPFSQSVRASPAAPLNALGEGLETLGWIDGQTYLGVWRYSEGKTDRLAELAAELVQLDVDVLVTLGGTPAARAAKQATRDIPIVMISVGDPVRLGLVDSLARPGGNATGLTNFAPEVAGKRLQLMQEALPKASRVGLVWNPDNPASQAEWPAWQAAGTALSIRIDSIGVRDTQLLAAAFAALAGDRPDALMVANDPVLSTQRAQVLEFVGTSGLPAMYFDEAWPGAGGLMAYGPSGRDIYWRAASYVDRILKGAKPADLPVEQPTKFEFVINLKTAQGLGLTIPQSVLQQATEVIR
jgi:putative ABC transport system substrate-binding protein